jgi:hypothetical protein
VKDDGTGKGQPTPRPDLARLARLSMLRGLIARQPKYLRTSTGSWSRSKSGLKLDPRWVAAEKQHTDDMAKTFDRLSEAVQNSAETMSMRKTMVAAGIESRGKKRAEKARVFFAGIKKKYAEIDNALKKVGEKKIDPGRWASQQSTFSKIMLTIAGFFGGVGGNPNGVSNMIAKAVDQDIAAQKADLMREERVLQQRRNSYSELVAHFKDEQKAEMALEQALFRSASMRLNALADQHRGTIQGLKYRYSGQLLKQQAASRMVQRTAQKWSVTKGGTSVRRPNPLQGQLALMAMRGLMAPGGPRGAKYRRMPDPDRRKTVEVATANDMMNQYMNSLMKASPPGYLGKGAAYVKSAVPKTKAHGIHKSGNILVGQIIRSLYGAQASEKETKRILGSVPDFGDSEARMRHQFMFIQNMRIKNLENRIQGLSDAGYDATPVVNALKKVNAQTQQILQKLDARKHQ